MTVPALSIRLFQKPCFQFQRTCFKRTEGFAEHAFVTLIRTRTYPSTSACRNFASGVYAVAPPA
eukprot:3903881-Pyramimonas_sp.AAC.1